MVIQARLVITLPVDLKGIGGGVITLERHVTLPFSPSVGVIIRDKFEMEVTAESVIYDLDTNSLEIHQRDDGSGLSGYYDSQASALAEVRYWLENGFGICGFYLPECRLRRVCASLRTD